MARRDRQTSLSRHGETSTPRDTGDKKKKKKIISRKIDADLFARVPIACPVVRQHRRRGTGDREQKHLKKIVAELHARISIIYIYTISYQNRKRASFSSSAHQIKKKKHTLSRGKRPNEFIDASTVKNSCLSSVKQTSHPLLFTRTAGRKSRSAHTSHRQQAKAQAKRGPTGERGFIQIQATREPLRTQYQYIYLYVQTAVVLPLNIRIAPSAVYTSVYFSEFRAKTKQTRQRRGHEDTKKGFKTRMNRTHHSVKQTRRTRQASFRAFSC